MSELEYIRVPISKEEELKLKKQQLEKLLETAQLMTPIIEGEDRGQTEEELNDHFNWITEIKQQLKDLDKVNI